MTLARLVFETLSTPSKDACLNAAHQLFCAVIEDKSDARAKVLFELLMEGSREYSAERS